MNRTRIVLPALALLMAATVSSCGSDSAPSNASTEEFCDGQTSLFDDITATADPDELVKKINAWADEVEEIGTPEDMSDQARAGFEETLDQARDIEASDLEPDKLQELGEELAGDAKEDAQAFNQYVTENCDLLGDLDMPEVPDTGDSGASLEESE